MESLHQLVSSVESQKYTNRWEEKKAYSSCNFTVSSGPKQENVHRTEILNVIFGVTQSMFFSYLLLKILSMWYIYLASICSSSPEFSSFSRSLLGYNIAMNYLLDYHSCKSKLGRNRADKSATLRETSCKSRNSATKRQTLLSQGWRWMAT